MLKEMSVFARTIMEQKYSHVKPDGTLETWDDIAKRVAENVMGAVHAPKDLVDGVREAIAAKKLVPAGRYLYAAGRPYHQTQNCLLLSVDDSREGWSSLLRRSSMALMTGAGIGIEYSKIRSEGEIIKKTGGYATGPIALMQMVNEVSRGVMQGGSRRCLSGDTMVTMGDYIQKKIKDINIDDVVFTRFGNAKVTGKYDQGVQPLVKITTEHGEVVCTRNHRWLAANAYREKKWIRAEKLTTKNKLYYIPSIIPGGNRLDLDWCYVMGYYMGNGCAYHSGRTHEITFQIPRKHHTQKQEELIVRVMSKTGTNPVVREGHGECFEIRCRSKSLVDEFQKWKSPNISPRIPEELFSSDIESRSAFLAGWFDADGSFTAGSWRLSNKHITTIESLRDMFKSLGITTSTLQGDGCYELRVNSYLRGRFMEFLGKYMFKQPRTYCRRRSIEIPSRILSIDDVPESHTYDIEVERVHEFVANGHVSHNSAVLAMLSWKHADIYKFVSLKNWSETIKKLKGEDVNFPATMDGTNISVQLDEEFFEAFHNKEHVMYSHARSVYWAVVEQMLKTGEPGFTVDIGANSGETLRNACGEATSGDDDDICNLGSVNMANIHSLEEMKNIVELGTALLLAGTVYSDVPYDEVFHVREKNRRLGLGLLGLHEWLLLRGKRYGPDSELEEYLRVYEGNMDVAVKYADKWGLSRPVKTRALAPTGTVGIVMETTTGIEPIFCVAYKRRYRKGPHLVEYQYVLDPTAKRLIERGIDPDMIEDAYILSEDIERRVVFQTWLQRFVDQGISSTINLPAWGTEQNNHDKVVKFGDMLMKYLPQLRGITVYPDGSRSGQPLTPIKYKVAAKHIGQVFVEAADVCDITKGGSCGS